MSMPEISALGMLKQEDYKFEAGKILLKEKERVFVFVC